MSMLSAQVDRLRELATRYDELQVGAVKAVTMPSDMGLILRDAADTIWELRDDLQRANAENAKLREDLEFERSENGWAREFLNRIGQKCGTKDCPSLVAYVTKTEAENAKLRKLVDGLTWCCEHHGCRQECPLYDVSEPDHCLEASIKRELGVEVDG